MMFCILQDTGIHQDSVWIHTLFIRKAWAKS